MALVLEDVPGRLQTKRNGIYSISCLLLPTLGGLAIDVCDSVGPSCCNPFDF